MQGSTDSLAFGDQCRHTAQRFVEMPQSGASGGLGDGRQVIRQTHQQDRVDDRGCGHQVSQAATGEGECLAHGPADDQSRRVLIKQSDRTGLRGKLSVGLVDDQHAGGHRLQQPSQIGRRNALPGGIVRACHENHVGLDGLDRGNRGVHVETEVGGAVGLDPLGLGAIGNDRMHRIGRHEAERGSPRTPERL